MEENNKKIFVEDLNKIIQFPPGGIFSKVLAKTNNFDCTIMCLSKGTYIDTHTSTKNGCLQVLKGKGAFNLYNKKKILLNEGVFIFMPANSPHSLKAKEDLAILLCLHK